MTGPYETGERVRIKIRELEGRIVGMTHEQNTRLVIELDLPEGIRFTGAGNAEVVVDRIERVDGEAA